MAHIKTIDEMHDNGIKTVNEEYHGHQIENQIRFLEDIIEDTDLAVLIKDVSGNTSYKPNEVIDDIEDFFYDCKGMTETCNGTNEVTCGGNLTYNICITDENGETYASIDFQLIYYNENTVSALQQRF